MAKTSIVFSDSEILYKIRHLSIRSLHNSPSNSGNSETSKALLFGG